MKSSLVRQIIELEDKPASELRELYNTIFDDKCNYNASKQSLKPKIAYRLQELSLGGLKKEIKAKLDYLAKGGQSGAAKHSELLPGTKIRKEHNGVVHEVEVLKNGFEYQGQHFRSLSAIARHITGTRWNGPKFFKVRA